MPIYKAIEDEETGQRINWFIDKIITKEQFLMEKHNISKLKMNIIRLFILLTIIINFYVFPTTLYLISTLMFLFKIPLLERFLFLNISVSLIAFCLTLIYARLGWLKKIILMGSILLYLILYLILYSSEIIIIDIISYV